MVRSAEYLIFFFITFGIMIAGLCPCLTYLRYSHTGNLLVQHLVFQLCLNPADHVIIKIRKCIRCRHILKGNLHDQTGDIQFLCSLPGKFIIEIFRLPVIHKILDKNHRVIFLSGNKNLPGLRLIPVHLRIHISNKHGYQKLLDRGICILIAKLSLAKPPEYTVNLLIFHSFHYAVIR